jgi:hypothetical protein
MKPRIVKIVLISVAAVLVLAAPASPSPRRLPVRSPLPVTVTIHQPGTLNLLGTGATWRGSVLVKTYSLPRHLICRRTFCSWTFRLPFNVRIVFGTDDAAFVDWYGSSFPDPVSSNRGKLLQQTLKPGCGHHGNQSCAVRVWAATRLVAWFGPHPGMKPSPTPPPPTLGTETNPYPVGQPGYTGAVGAYAWMVRVNSVNWNANGIVGGLNPPPPAGSQYVLVSVSVARAAARGQILEPPPRMTPIQAGLNMSVATANGSGGLTTCTSPTPDYFTSPGATSGSWMTWNLCSVTPSAWIGPNGVVLDLAVTGQTGRIYFAINLVR